MNDLYSQNDYDECDLLTVEGQISFLLLDSDRPAGELYSNVKASQPTVSRKIARMIDQGMIDQRVSSADRRVPIFSLSVSYRNYLISTNIVRTLSEKSSFHSQTEDYLIDSKPA